VSLLSPLLVALGWLLLVPDPVAAWGPATHVALGEALLGALYLLPPAVQALLGKYPLHFLYGSVAADISLAKKYVPEGRHCHNWSVGEEILETADSEPLRAVGYGYLAHLAADTVAHNMFVPRQLLLTSTTQALGHTYWEHRMDVHVGEEFLRKARHLVMDHDHADADTLFDDVLSRTIFSFRTNRRIFRGMIRFQGHDRWQQVFERVLANSRFDLPDPTVDHYFELAFDHVVGYLRAGSSSFVGGLDPVGDLNLRLAKKVRRLALSDRTADHPEVLAAMADDFFPFPPGPRLFWPQVEDPAFAAGITARRGSQRALPARSQGRSGP
jgi:hypothetical protein